MSEQANAPEIDLSTGVKLAEFNDRDTIAGKVAGEPVLLSRFDGKFFAVSGRCTHYGALLKNGLLEGEDARCPWHHSCFSLRTGEVLRNPAFDPLDRYEVAKEGDTVFVRGKKTTPVSQQLSARADLNALIVGGGAAGLACASELRRLGQQGSIKILSADTDPPYDRPNLSKDFLAGTAPGEWMPLRSASWYRDHDVDLRVNTRVHQIDLEGESVITDKSERLSFDKLLLATGCEPRKLSEPGFDAENVFVLRSFADARSIAAKAKDSARAAIIGSSFIAMEAAAALRARQVEVHVISPEKVPFARIFGEEIGAFLRALHESKGVRFHLGTVPSNFDGKRLLLADQSSLETDFVLLGIGVSPRSEIASAAGLAVDINNGICVNEYLETEASGVFAAGDVAAYPDPLTGERIRIEHWVLAERQGQTVAANMLGLHQRFQTVPFFWTMQEGTALRSVGNSKGWDEVRIDGEIRTGKFTARYFIDQVHVASVTAGRDRGNLEEEKLLERAIADAKPVPASAGG